MRNFNEKPKIKSNSIYFQLGLIVALAVALFFIEQTSVKKTYKDKAVKTDVFTMEDSYDEPLVVEKEQVKKVEKVERKEPEPLPTEPNYIEPDPEDIFENKEPTVDEDDLNLDEPNTDEPIAKIPDVDKNYAVTNVSEIPVFPGCDRYETREEKFQCFSEKIRELVVRKYDSGLGEELGLQGKQKIYVNFTINKEGEIVDVKARSTHKILADEAKRVTKLLPKMKPGKQNGQAVNVNYSLPILLDIQ